MKKGLVPPSQNKDGTVSIGVFKIVKDSSGYTIYDRYNDIVVDHINLPQTAILVANGLALGKFKDTTVINNDKQYGYALFDEEAHKKVANSKRSSIEHYDVMSVKAGIAKEKKEFYKKDLLERYRKLVKYV
jgi:hypothetical protein